MSRLCRLKTKSHGEDGLWAYEEITRLRGELAAAREENERLKAELEHAFRVLDKAEICADQLAALKSQQGVVVGKVIEVIEYHVEGLEYGRMGKMVRDVELLDKTLPVGTPLYTAAPREQICIDEGCPHHGTTHVCVNPMKGKSDAIRQTDCTVFTLATSNLCTSIYRAYCGSRWSVQPGEYPH